MTHIHVEVYVNGESVKVTQMAFPDSITAAVYETDLYAAKGLNPIDNASDMVFADGADHELAELIGDTSTGYAATLALGLAL